MDDRLIITIATNNIIEINDEKYQFDEDSLKELARTIKGKSIDIGLHNSIGKVIDAWYNEDLKIVEANIELKDLYLSPGFTISSSIENEDGIRIFKKVRAQQLIITLKPSDPNITKLELITA